MSKLKLNLEALEVTSFDTDASAEGRGTVHAASDIRPISQRPRDCFFSENVTGSCCDITLAPSCIQTQCDECLIITASTCP